MFILLLLLLSLMFWMLIPILGIFPLLIWIQINLLKTENFHRKYGMLINILLFLVITTLSIFFTGFTVYSDTITYIDTYASLTWNDIISFSIPFTNTIGYGGGREIITFALAYPVKILSDNSPYWFLFNHSFIINTLVVFFIAKKLSRDFYPIILIILFSTPAYYNQVFIMRQFLSNTFLLNAIVTMMESNVLFYFYSFLSLFSHFNSLPYLIILMFIKLRRSKHKKLGLETNRLSEIKWMERQYLNKKLDVLHIKKNLIIKILYIFLALIVAAIFIYGVQELSVLLSLLPKPFNLITERYDHYLLNTGSDSFYFGNVFSIGCILIFIGVWQIKINYTSLEPKMIALITTFVIQATLAFIPIGQIQFRLAFFLISFQGIFYYLLTDNSENKKLRFLVFPYAILSLANFIRFLVTMPSYPITGGSLVFFDGKPLSMHLLDYLRFLVDAEILS